MQHLSLPLCCDDALHRSSLRQPCRRYLDLVVVFVSLSFSAAILAFTLAAPSPLTGPLPWIRLKLTRLAVRRRFLLRISFRVPRRQALYHQTQTPTLPSTPPSSFSIGL